MKSILVTQRVLVDPSTGTRQDALDQRWPLFLSGCSLLPVIIPNNSQIAVAIAKSLDTAGLLLTGGNDLAMHGGDVPERDSTELALLNWARSLGKPVLGVCRGMQLIQTVFGVRLSPCEGHQTVGHDIITTFGSAPRSVKSNHRWGSRDSVPSLEVWAFAEDGSVEAVRHGSEPISGIMWHPEFLFNPDPADVDLFRSIFASHD